MPIKTERLKRRIIGLGADLVDVADLSDDDVQMAMPGEFQHFTRAVSIAVYYQDKNNGSYGRDDSDDTKHRKILSYMEESNDAIETLGRILRSLEKEFKMRRFKYFSLPPIHNSSERKFSSYLHSLFPHRTAATCAGLGWIGKNGMLLNKKYGPNLFWATILTNAPLKPSSTKYTEGQCFSCGICESVCPVSAIKGINWTRDMGNDELVDIKACSDFMVTNEPKYGLPVCGICFMSCPIGDIKGLAKQSATG